MCLEEINDDDDDDDNLADIQGEKVQGEMCRLRLVVVCHVTEIDECEDDTLCEPGAECVNEMCTYQCQCKPGFSGDTTCQGSLIQTVSASFSYKSSSFYLFLFFIWFRYGYFVLSYDQLQYATVIGQDTVTCSSA